MRRRQFLTSAALLAGSAAIARAPALAADSTGGSAGHAIPHLLDEYLQLPGKKSAQIDVDEATAPWRVTSEPDAELFVGSCFKTFVLAAYLQEVEAGRLDELEQLAVDDSVRSLVSPVLQNLTGTTQARSVLEAMIAHSDNTATDVAMKRVTPARVRQFISDAGLTKARIPDSTRRLFSYIAGAPQGEDLGWKAMQAIVESKTPDTSKYRPALNDVESMAVPASEFVTYYKRALTGGYFQKPETLTEFKRIQAMADAIARGGARRYGRLHEGRLDRLERLSLPRRRRADDRARHARHIRAAVQLDGQRRRPEEADRRLQGRGRRHPQQNSQASGRGPHVAPCRTATSSL